MNGRRLTVVLGAAFALLLGSAGLAGAGIQVPHDMLATPSTGPVGQVVVITNAANSPCGGQQGDGPADMFLAIIKPDDSELDVTSLPVDENGNWTYSYTQTDQVGTYTVEGTCNGQSIPQQTGAVNFDYTDATFDITARGDDHHDGGADHHHHHPDGSAGGGGYQHPRLHRLGRPLRLRR